MEEGKIWGICCPDTDSGALRKKFVFATSTEFWAANFWAYAPGYYLTFVCLARFDLSDGKNSKKSVFVNCSVLTDFCLYLHLSLGLFLFEFFWGKELFEEVATVAYVILDASLMLELNSSGFIILMH